TWRVASAVRVLQLAVALLLYLPLVSALPTIQERATVCNGRAELCNRSYGNVTFLTSHDSFASSPNPLALARTQQIDLNAQMKLGVRGLQAQSHMKDGRLFDGGSVLDYLKKVKAFMDANPNEVFTFIFTNPENLSPKSVWDPIFQQAGLVGLAYVPPHLPMKASEWPTLGQMIDSVDYGANTAEVPYILPEFDHVWEPPFSSTDPSFPCRVDRISGPLSSQDHMFMINHNLNAKVSPWKSKRLAEPEPVAKPGWFDSITSAIGNGVDHVKDTIDQGVDHVKDTIDQVGDNVNTDALPTILVPDFLSAPRTNGMASILADSNGCSAFSGGKAANFVLLDFVDIGQGMKTVNLMNG
ncbi:9188_t:CDS:2, partial [Acaulospora colombiana]